MKVRACLVVPDSDSLRTLVGIFQQSDFELHVYPEAQKALAEWDAIKPDLALSEWKLLDMDGDRFCRQVLERSPGVPFFFLTDIRDSDTRLKAVQAGALDLFTKPFDREMLVAKIRAALRIAKNHSGLNGGEKPFREAPSGESSILQKIFLENDLRTNPGRLFQEFLRLEKRQHILAQKSCAVLNLNFRQIPIQEDKHDLRRICGIVLLLKKVIQPGDSLFFDPPDGLILFMSYTDSSTAVERETKIRHYLRGLDLDSFVQINLVTHNHSKVLDLLEKEIAAT
ncbi:MAG: response regulator [bacterium]